MKHIIFLGAFADMLIFAWLLISGLVHLWNWNAFEASALVIAAVMYQRAWKAELLRKIAELKKGSSNDY